MQVSNRQVLIRPGEGRSLPGIVFKVHALDTGGPFSIVEHPYAPRVLIPPTSMHPSTRSAMCSKGL